MKSEEKNLAYLHCPSKSGRGWILKGGVAGYLAKDAAAKSGHTVSGYKIEW